MKIDITHEISFQTARSGGKGGQNVNKVESMVEGRWNVDNSCLVSACQKEIIHEKLSSRITDNGILLVRSQEERSQLGNKSIVIKKMNSLVNAALHVQKRRVPTKPSRAAERKRMENKKQHAIIKQLRRKTNRFDD